MSTGLAFGPRPLRRGGANNRADRVSYYLSRQQAENLIAAAAYAEARGWAFSRHWTVHCEKAGIPDWMAAEFVTRLIAVAKRCLKRRGVELVVIWVRENSEKNGSHVHILMHLSKPTNLRNQTRKWVEAAGGLAKAGVSLTKTIGGRLDTEGSDPAHYWANVDVVLSYILKGCSPEVAHGLGLSRFGQGGEVIGKRFGCSQSVARGARQKYFESDESKNHARDHLC